MDLEAFRQAMRVGVRDSSGVPDGRVIFHFPGAPLPGGDAPFVVISPHTAIAPNGYGPEVDLSPEEDGVVAYWARRTVTVGINVYGTEAMAVALAMTEALEHEPIADAMRAGGAVLRRVGELRDLSAFLEVEPRERAQVDLFFGVVSATEAQVGQIEHVEALGLYQAGASGELAIPLAFELEGP